MSPRASFDTVAGMESEKDRSTDGDSSTLLTEEQSFRWAQKEDKSHLKRFLHPAIYTLLVLSIVGLLAWNLLITHRPYQDVQAEHPRTDCGSTVAEAREKGCHFDMMSWLWVPHECFDAELVEEFIALRDWDWYRNYTGGERVPLEEVRTGMHDALWAPQQYHMFHCTYMWKKMHRAILRHGPLDDDVASFDHTVHCEKMLLEPGELAEVNTLVTAEMVGCSYV
ncbi:MAG: hypothetical protein LQ351_006152 [Letrouitia transgressa]|nr:MAG: hypothetical protein LQ351_006152 [Letrouitia transgressa]